MSGAFLATAPAVRAWRPARQPARRPALQRPKCTLPVLRPLFRNTLRVESCLPVSDKLPALVAEFVAGDRSTLDELMPAVYVELRRLAGRYMSRETPGHTLQATALLHEAYLRMVGQRNVDWHNRAQLLAIAARMMRRVLLDHAAARHAVKRGGDLLRITLTDDFALAAAGSVDLLDLDRTLQELQAIDAQQAAVVELRFFGGMSDEEIGGVLEISPATVRRRWSSARLWLARRLAETPQQR